MEIFIVIILIVTGILLLLLEFLVIPGIAVAGIGGVAFLIGGVIYSYKALGDTGGNITLLLSVVIFVATLIWVLRSKTWNKAMLKTEIDGVVNEDGMKDIMPGDQGLTMSRLAPMGKIRINGRVVEAKSMSGYINPDTKVEVIKVQNTNVIVKLVKI